MKIINEVNKVFLNDYEKFDYMTIEYKGSFEAEVVSDGYMSISDKNNKIFLFKTIPNQTGVIFTYKGNLIINKAYHYKNNNKKYLDVDNYSDETQRINSKWNESTSKYLEFKNTNKNKPFKKTKLIKRNK